MLLEVSIEQGQIVERLPKLPFDPGQPTDAEPGTRDKLKILEARYLMGMPLWIDGDRKDHNPLPGDLPQAAD